MANYLIEQCKRSISAISPRVATEIIFYKNFGRRLNLKRPQDFNEKIQWLKLNTYYKNETITLCVDKSRVNKYLEKRGLLELCPQLYGVYERVEDIPWDKLPQAFAIKCNHGSGMNIICPDKSILDVEAAKRKLSQWMKWDFWKDFAEVQYRDVQHKIVVEELLDPRILTYKFYCFHGEPKIVYVQSDGENGEPEKYIDFFDINWTWENMTLSGHENAPVHPKRPVNYEEMIEITETLSREFPFVRVDLYNLEGKIYFSELTFIPTGGLMKMNPKSVIEKWGEWLELPVKEKRRKLK